MCISTPGNNINSDLFSFFRPNLYFSRNTFVFKMCISTTENNSFSVPTTFFQETHFFSKRVFQPPEIIMLINNILLLTNTIHFTRTTSRNKPQSPTGLPKARPLSRTTSKPVQNHIWVFDLLTFLCLLLRVERAVLSKKRFMCGTSCLEETFCECPSLTLCACGSMYTHTCMHIYIYTHVIKCVSVDVLMHVLMHVWTEREQIRMLFATGEIILNWNPTKHYHILFCKDLQNKCIVLLYDYQQHTTVDKQHPLY